MENSKPKISTMKELSKTIGISRPTLSRYFQDASSVRASTSRKIQERLAEVDYVYNFIATRQNRKSSGLIGVIIPHFSDLFYTTLLEVIEEASRDTGHTIITQSSDGSAKLEAQAMGKLRSMSVDGAIIAPLGLESFDETFAIASSEFPIVFADSRPMVSVPGSDFVGTDNVQGISAMVEYLCRTGEAPVFLGMPPLNTNALEREDAYKTQMRALGEEPVLVDAIGADKSWYFEAYGYAVMDDHFSHQRFSSATILCANDRIAIGAIRAANKHGLFGRSQRSSGGLRIAGHDNHPLSQYMYPAISTVAQDIDGIGREAVRLLMERIRGERVSDPVHLLKESTLMLREST